MTEHDKPEFFSRLNAIMEVFGKLKVTTAAAQVWWDALRDLPTPDVFGCLSYWAQTNTKAPAPADVWKIANEHRTNHIEARAKQERMENIGQALPDGWAPTPYGREMAKRLKAMVKL